MVDAKGFPDHHRPITTSLDALGFQGPHWYLKQESAKSVDEIAREDDGLPGHLTAAHKVILSYLLCD